MKSKIKTGEIQYLNFLPFNWREYKRKDIEFIQNTPSSLSKSLLKGNLDSSFVSSVAGIENTDKWMISNSLVIASRGSVKSVKLISHYPMSKLRGGVIGLSDESLTSVFMLKKLIEEVCGDEVSYLTVPNICQLDRPGLSAQLLIGDSALKVKEKDFPFIWDLGELFREEYGFDAIFGVFCAASENYRKQPEVIQKLISHYEKNVKDFFKNIDSILREKGYEEIDLLKEYYNGLIYRFDDKTLQSFYSFIGMYCQHSGIESMELEFF